MLVALIYVKQWIGILNSRGVAVCNGIIVGGSHSMLVFIAGWTTYGYVLINSAENDCGANPETSKWYYLMIFLLVIGSITYLIFGMLIFKFGVQPTWDRMFKKEARYDEPEMPAEEE
jgi:hypothetical protein